MFHFVPDGGCWWLWSTACELLWTGPHLHSGAKAFVWITQPLNPDIFSLCELLSRGWMDAFKPALRPEDWELSIKRHFPLVFLQVLYEDSQMVTLTAPYIPGFLGFRESPFLLEALQRLKGLYPELMPQVRFLNFLFASHNSHHKMSSAWTNKYLYITFWKSSLFWHHTRFYFQCCKNGMKTSFVEDWALLAIGLCLQMMSPR